jgi:hypothetical protein
MTSVTPMAMKKREDVVTDGGIADDIVKMRRRRKITSSSCRRWWSSHVLGLSGRRARAHLCADRHHFARARCRPGTRAEDLRNMGLPQPGELYREEQPDGTILIRQVRAVRTREEESRTEEQFRLRQSGPNDRTDVADARASARDRLRKKEITAAETDRRAYRAVEARARSMPS